MILEIEKLRVLIQKIMFNESGLGDRFAYFLDTENIPHLERPSSLYTRFVLTNETLKQLAQFLHENPDV